MKKLFKAAALAFLVLVSVTALQSCSDDAFYDDGPQPFDGEVSIDLDFEFEEMTNALESRGLAGNYNFDIEKLTILFYEENAGEDGAPKYSFVKTRGDFAVYKRETRPDTHCEETTVHGKVKLSGIEGGKYRIYGVANVDVPENTSEKQLREIRISWPAEVQTSSANTGLNSTENGVPSAMFGYFTYEGVLDHTVKKYRDVVHHNTTKGLYTNTDEAEDKGKTANRAPVVTLDREHLEMQAWLKRVVSKLTIGYDGSALNNGISIYIKSVAVKDAAASCFLGHDNSVGDLNDVSGQTVELLNNDTYAADQRLSMTYTDQEGASGPCITRYTPAFPHEKLADDVNTRNTAGTGWNEEWYESIHGSWANPSPMYDGKPTTMYFFENLQGVAEGSPKLNTDENGPEKDGRANGTYIEVKAYYKNTIYGEEAEGDIVYRFMLGKNIVNDFNVERNHHYKLILSFMGDANTPSWHIELEEEQKPYFRIPYDLDYLNGDEYAYTDAQNNETWYKNENWKHSNVWYAYYEDEPVAEIAKEIVFYRDDYTTKLSGTSNIRKALKYYQVVTVYPIREDGTTDLNNGLIVQVLDCDDPEETAQNFYTKTGGAAISMHYRYELYEQYNKNVDKDLSRSFYTIKGCELTPSIANGTDEHHDNYLYIEYDPETKQLQPSETPKNILLKTRPYRVQDKDRNSYPIVKVGSAYWFRENLRATETFSAQEILGYGSNDCATIIPYKTSKFDGNYPGCLYLEDAPAMYRTIEGDDQGQKYGYLYNLATLTGSEEYDPYFFVDEENEEKLTSEEQKACLLQFEDRFIIPQKWAVNEWQITPKDWHIPYGEGDIIIDPEKNLSTDEIWQDHQYLLKYLGSDFYRAVVEDEKFKWPSTKHPDKQLKKRNLADFYLYALPAVYNSQEELSLYSVNEKNPNKVIVPYWTATLYSYQKDGEFYYFGAPPIVDNSKFSDNENEGELMTDEFTDTDLRDYFITLSGQYFPVRPCRNNFPESYKAQSWAAIGSLWSPQE